MSKLRIPGSWKAGVQSVAGVAAAAYASSLWAVVQSFQEGRPIHGLWVCVAGAGSTVLFGAVVAYRLHRRGALEFIGPEEEEALRRRRVLTLEPATKPLRGVGAPEEADEVPPHIKRLTLAAVLTWGLALPVAAFLEWERAERLFCVWLAVVASATAAFFYVVHKARTAARVVAEASEDP